MVYVAWWVGLIDLEREGLSSYYGVQLSDALANRVGVHVQSGLVGY